MKTKHCSKCGCEKQLSEFYIKSESKDGYTSQCAGCIRDYNHRHYKDTHIPKRQVSRSFYCDGIQMKQCLWCGMDKNIDEFDIHKRNKDGHRAICKECRKQQHNDHKDEINAKRRRLRLEDGDEIRRKERQAFIDNPLSKIKKSLRDRLYRVVKGRIKAGSAVCDLGCSIDELKQHLEKQFYPHPETGEAMTWENYGLYGWHIDHIEPLDSFELEDRTQFLKACNYKNLQPLWAEHNLSKSDKKNWSKVK